MESGSTVAEYLRKLLNGGLLKIGFFADFEMICQTGHGWRYKASKIVALMNLERVKPGVDRRLAAPSMQTEASRF